MSILKPILGALAIIEASIFFICFVFTGLAERLYDFLEIIFPTFNIYYSSQSVITALYTGTGLAFLILVLKNKNEPDKVSMVWKCYEKITIPQLFFANFLFPSLIYLGNIFLKDFDGYNNYTKQKYGR